MIKKLGSLAVLGVTVALLLAGCSAGQTPGDSPSGSTPGLSGSITVLAAASLTDTFNTIGADFEKANPGTKITFSYGSSATLASHITNGAPADVFASASPATMDTVDKAGLAVGRVDFVSNTLEIAVPKGNPGHITGLKDFADPAKKIVVCDKTVPCGAAAVKVFAAAGITPQPDSYATDVKAALTQVSTGEADAALVYKTDVKAAGDQVEGINFPEAADAVNIYPICTVKGSANEALATAFAAYVRSDAGMKVLTDAGFDKP